LNILLIGKRHYTSHDLLDDRFGRLYHFPARWADQGHNVKVVVADYSGTRPERLSVGGLDMRSYPLFRIRNGFTRQLPRIADELNPDIVVASCDSHFGFIGSRMARRRKLPFVFDLYHNYEDFGSNRIPGMKRLYDAALRSASLVVCDSEPLSDMVGPRSRRTFVAPQGTDLKHFYPADKKESRQKLGIDLKQSVLVYVGSIDSRFDIDCVFAALDRLADDGIDIHLLIAGTGKNNPKLRHPRLTHLGMLGQEQVPVVIAAADVCLIPYRSTPLSETCNPCKLSEYIACQRPIVSSRVSNIADYLPASGQFCYEPGDDTQLTSMITAQLDRPVVESAEHVLTWERIADGYLAELVRLVDGDTQ
jgi:glycosyltransferase involved in cell wall biosynthesis